MNQDQKIHFLKLTIFFLISLLIIQWIFPAPKTISNETTETLVVPESESLKRVPISLNTKELSAEINGTNLQLDQVSFKTIFETVSHEKTVSLLNQDLWFEWGFLSNTTAPVVGKWIKTKQTPQSVSYQQKVKNLLYTVSFSLTDDYMMTVTQNVKNSGAAPETVWNYARAVSKSSQNASAAIHTGWIGYLNDEFVEHAPSDLIDEVQKTDSTTGWFGWTNHYTQAVLMADSETTVSFSSNKETSQADLKTPDITLNAGQEKTLTSSVYLGPKKEIILKKYEDAGFKNLSHSVDYGWFYIFAKPMAGLLSWLNTMLGNMGIAIIILTLIVRWLLWPLSQKSTVAMAKMRDLQPKIKALQAKYAGDKIRLQQEMVKLYQSHKVSPASGCLPVLLQIPIFFALYQVLMVSFDLRQASFLYVPDLSQADPTSLFNLFGLLPFEIPIWLPALGLLPILMGVSMWVQQKMQGTTSTAPQSKILAYLPFIFVLMFGGLPAGLVLYWMMSNVFSLLQTWLVQKQTRL